MTPVAKRPLTVEEFWALPEGEGKRELVRGEVVEEMPSGVHGGIAAEISYWLKAWLKQGHEGYVGVEVAFLLARSPDLLRLPDVCFVGPEKLAGGIAEKYWQIAPDLAIEVISPSETWDQVQEKVEEYLLAGTRMVWTVHSRTKRVVVYTPDAVARTYKAEETLELPELLPGFSCKVSAFFGV
jgi:Uma2 family endonuclease